MNTLTSLNLLAVTVIRYGVGEVHWQNLNYKNWIGKLLRMYRAYHPQNDKNKENAVNIEVNSLRKYTCDSKEKLLNELRIQRIVAQEKEKRKIKLEKENSYRNKGLHGRYFVATDVARGEKSRECSKKGGSKKETEKMIMTVQEQALRTRNIRKVIDKKKIDRMCRICGEKVEAVAHIFFDCKKLSQKECKNWLYYRVVLIIHCELHKNMVLR